jgi:multiple sugar transport system permease protein
MRGSTVVSTATPARPVRPVARTGTAASRARRHRDGAWALLFLAPQLIGLIAFVLGPLIGALLLSLTNWNGIGAWHFVGLQNFRTAFADPTFWASLKNTAWFTVLLVPSQLVCALLVALALNNTRGSSIYRVLFFMPVVTSSAAVSVVWLWLLNGQFGPLNSLLHSWFGVHPPNWLGDPHFIIPALVMVSVWQGLGFTIVVFQAGLQGIPEVYLDAARVDGAGAIRRFREVTLPLLTPTIFFLTIISLIGAFQVFDIVYLMTPDNSAIGNAAHTVVYHIYDLAFVQYQYGAGAAVAVILFVLLLILTLTQLVFQRRWVHYED